MDDESGEGEHEAGQASRVWHELVHPESDWMLVRQEVGKGTHLFSPEKGVKDEACIRQLVPGERVRGLCASRIGIPCLAKRRVLKIVP